MTTNEFSQALSGMDPFELALGAGFLGAIAMVVIFGSILWFFISALGYRKMFMKAGEAGWKAFIPYYKSYICFKFAWCTKMFWPYLLCSVAVQLMPEAESMSLLLTLINLVCLIYCIVLGIKLNIRVAASFGKSAGWGVLLFFFSFIVSLILGYGKAEYIGNTTVAAPAAPEAAAETTTDSAE